jgi:hypothetical protein
MGTFDRRKNSPYPGQFADANAPKRDARATPKHDARSMPKRDARALCRSEPSLDELLAEPMIKLAMAADRIDPAVVYALFREVRQKMDGFCRI